MKKNNVSTENLLDKVPVYKEGLNWSIDEKGAVTLEMENKGVANRIAQKLLKKPEISYIHLEETGSFIWPLIDGERTVYDIGQLVQEHFGEKANPLYERLSVYLGNLEKYGFITYK